MIEFQRRVEKISASFVSLNLITGIHSSKNRSRQPKILSLSQVHAYHTQSKKVDGKFAHCAFEKKDQASNSVPGLFNYYRS